VHMHHQHAQLQGQCANVIQVECKTPTRGFSTAWRVPRTTVHMYYCVVLFRSVAAGILP
jgi:hypothetical protein